MTEQEYFKQCYPHEGVVAIIDNQWHALNNVSDTPREDFRVDGQEWLNLIVRYGEPSAVIHSHTHAEIRKDRWGHIIDPRTPSFADMQSCEVAGIPFGITHCDGNKCLDTLWIGKPSSIALVGRPYIYGVYDCITIVRDYYFQNHGLVFDDVPREFEWSVHGDDTIMRNFLEKGFKNTFVSISEKREFGKLNVGDILVFTIPGTKFPNHCGIYVGEGRYLHHMVGYDSTYQNVELYAHRVTHVLRYL